MLKQASLALAVVVILAAANMAEARGHRHKCCGCDSGGCPAAKTASTAPDASKPQVAKEAPPAPTEDKTAEAKKPATDTKSASTESTGRSRRHLLRR